VRPAFIDKDELLLVVGGDGLTPGGARLLVAPARRACSSRLLVAPARRHRLSF
jgi:hypothetical protein